MKRKCSFKRVAALVLAAVMTLGAVPVPGLVHEAHADTEDLPLSTMAYADVDTLLRMSGSSAGDVQKSGRIKLGKDSKGAVMEWIVMGMDIQIDGDNIAVFAGKNLIEHDQYVDRAWQIQKFQNSNTDLITWSNDYGTYDDGYIPEKVWPNHYGASALRAALIAYAESDKFSDAERSLLQATTVDTPDYKGSGDDDKLTSPKVYYTTDKLYAAWGDPKWYGTVSGDKYTNGGDKTYIFIGTNRDKKIDYTTMGQTWSNWLRTPDASASGNYFARHPVWYGDGSSQVINGNSVRPATNFSLKNTLFASAAMAASDTAPTAGKIKTADDTTKITKDAMMLRLDPKHPLGGGSEVKIGSLICDTEEGTIAAKKDDLASGTVSLIVQGAYEDTDWYYSTQVADSASVTVSDIAQVLADKKVFGEGVAVDTIAGYIDLSECAIWLETPVDDAGTLFYASGVHTHRYSDDASAYKSDGTHHWKDCTDVNCPDPDGARKDSEWYGEHDYTDAEWSYDDDYHYKKCVICSSLVEASFKDKAEHTLDEDGKCSCGYDVNKKYEWVEVPRQEPTCTEPGYEQYWHYDAKGYDVKYRSRGLGTLEKFTNMSEIEIAAAGHKPGEEYDHDETAHWLTCTVCEEAVDKADHTYRGRTCTVCGYEKPAGRSDDDDDDGSSGSWSSGSSGYSSASGTWSSDKNGWRFIYTNGSYPKGSIKTEDDGRTTLYVAWAQIGSNWFAFDDDGYMVRDWVYDAESGYWYYCDANYGMKRGWLYTPVDGCWYYLDPNNGKMHTGWNTIDGKRYFFSQTHNGTYYQDPVTLKWVYANPAELRPLGSMYESTMTPDGSLVGADGAYIEQMWGREIIR